MSPGDRFLEAAPQIGVDLSLFWATTDPAVRTIRQVCLAVPGAGRTALLFVSSTPVQETIFRTAGRSQPTDAASQAERASVIRAACEFCAAPPPDYTSPHGLAYRALPREGAKLAQALVEPRELPAIHAFLASGFTRLGDLAYMRRPAPAAPPVIEFPPLPLPRGVTTRSVASLLAEGIDPREVDRLLVLALERTYKQTLDCPELCGLREAADVLESHRAVGVYDPALWWLVTDESGDGQPDGVVLFSIVPDQQGVELVYLGLSPRLRGRGIGLSLMHLGLDAIARRRAASFRASLSDPAVPGGSTPVYGPRAFPGGIVCAVDTRNAPALRLYRRLGFQRFGVRVPLVRGLSSRGSTL